MLFRSLRSLAGRGLAAGAASALALTLFNAAQPSLSSGHQIQPGTVKDVPVSLAPEGVDNPARHASASATLPLRGAAPGPGSVKAASVAGGPQVKAAAQIKSGTARTRATQTKTGAKLLSAPVAVGKARFVGFSWPDSGASAREGTVWLRARTASGWSGWREVEEADGGPDATSSEYRPGRAYSDGQWLEAGTDEVQVRVDPPASTGKAAEAATAPAPAEQASGLEAHLITPDLTPTPGTEAPQAGVATAATRQPAIVSRARWGADERIRRAKPSYSDTVKAAFVHHTVQSNRYSPSESAALVRSDYLYHVKTRGWNDVGYNFLVDRYGRVFEGRYGGITRAVLGAHSGGFNTNSTGVGLLGDFSSARPPARMLAALERLLAWKLDLTHVDPRGRTTLRSAGGANVRYPAGRKVVLNTITGHRSTSYTACPGNPTIALLPRIRAAVDRIGRPKIYGGAATSSRVRPERAGYAEVRARFSSTARWRLTVTGSNGARVRSFSGRGASARIRWNGRGAGGGLAPPGWATLKLTAAAGGASARPASSRVFVLRTAPPAGSSTGGFTDGAWRVSNANAEQLSTSAGVFASYRWGRKGDLPVVGDWDGDGTQTLGVVRPSQARDGNHLLLRNSDGSVLDYWFGRYGDRILVGDWNGDRAWTPAAVRSGTWTLRETHAPDSPVTTLSFGRSGDRYLAGDWDGDGDFTPGVHRAGAFWLRNSAGSGRSEIRVRFGRANDLGVVGDWNANGTWTPGVLRAGSRWYLKDSLDGGAASVGLKKQTPGAPVVGDWDNRP